jgi:tetratricopeptide (TPR) repeat protein
MLKLTRTRATNAGPTVAPNDEDFFMNTMQTDEDERSVATLDHIDRLDPPRRNNPPPILNPPRYSAAAHHEDESYSRLDSQARVLPRLLAMADTYRASGSLRQAIEMYFELMRDYNDSPQAITSEERLLEIANSYVRSGELRQARGIYDRLL